MKAAFRFQPVRSIAATDFDPRDAELIATIENISDREADDDVITLGLYVTEQRAFFIVEQFYAFDGRPASNTRRVAPDQVRDWCSAHRLEAGVIDRYLTGTTQSAPSESVSLLTRHWDSDAAGQERQ